MAGVYFERSALEALVEHHVGIVERYSLDREDGFCVVALSLKNLLQSSIKNALQKILRESDAVVNEGDDYFLLLPSTKQAGAKKLVESIFEYLGRESEYKIFSYASNGMESEQNIDEFLTYLSKK